MRATLHNYHQSPRKVRLLADLIRGKSVPAAVRALAFLPKKSAPAVAKLLNSALANARASGVAAEQLFVRTITVNKGTVQKKGRPFARGRSGVIRKTMSHVTLELGKIPVPVAKPIRASGRSKKPATGNRQPATSL